LASFSSVGPVLVDGSGRIKPDVLAPGVDVLSAWPENGYKSISGTSMAGPHLVGTVALMWSANPALRGDVVRTREIIEKTATRFAGNLEGSEPLSDNSVSDNIVGAAGPLAGLLAVDDRSCLAQSDLTTIPNNVAGYGVVDVYAAVQAALALR
jgi:subtilisin family serine protease